jgi:hypothetical protein
MFAKYRRELATWEYKVFLVALVVMFLHLTEDTLVHEESGSSVGAKLGATVLNLLLAAVGAALYPLLWRRVLPLLVLAYGALALVAGEPTSRTCSTAMPRAATTPGPSSRSPASC